MMRPANNLVRRGAAILVPLVLAAACTTADPGTTDGPEVSVLPTEVTATDSTSSPATQPPTTVPTTTTLPPVADLADGLFCRDLAADGYEYPDAVEYWNRQGMPDRMDADRNGIPCETVFDEADVLAYWGDPLPTTTTTTPPAWTLAGIESRMARDWPPAWTWWSDRDWACEQETSGVLGAGSVVTCRPRVIPEGQHPVLTVLVLDDTTLSVAVAGVEHPLLNAGAVGAEFAIDSLCGDLLAEDSPVVAMLPGDGHRYVALVLYWFGEGMPDRMDADRNGLPCETLVDAAVVAEFWAGEWYGLGTEQAK